jgi:hypothetical protein
LITKIIASDRRSPPASGLAGASEKDFPGRYQVRGIVDFKPAFPASPENENKPNFFARHP